MGLKKTQKNPPTTVKLAWHFKIYSTVKNNWLHYFNMHWDNMSHVQDFNGLERFTVLCQLFQTLQFCNYALMSRTSIKYPGARKC